MNLKEVVDKLASFFENEKTLARATLMDYFAANAPPMAQYWRSTYIDGKNLLPTDPEYLAIEVRWRWTYAKKMVELRPRQNQQEQVSFEKVTMEK